MCGERRVHAWRQPIDEQRMLFELRDRFEKSRAIARDLAGAEAENVVQRGGRRRALFRELDQCAILSHDIGRQLCRCSELQPQGS